MSYSVILNGRKECICIFKAWSQSSILSWTNYQHKY